MISEPETFLKRFKVILNTRCFSFSSCHVEFYRPIRFYVFIRTTYQASCPWVQSWRAPRCFVLKIIGAFLLLFDSWSRYAVRKERDREGPTGSRIYYDTISGFYKIWWSHFYRQVFNRLDYQKETFWSGNLRLNRLGKDNESFSFSMYLFKNVCFLFFGAQVSVILGNLPVIFMINSSIAR